MPSNCGAGEDSCPLDSEKIKPVSLEGDQPWIPRRTDAEAEAPVYWSSGENSQLIGKVPDAGKDWGQKEKRASEDEMARWHTNAMDMNLGKLQEMVRDRDAWHAAARWVTKSQTWVGDWITEERSDILISYAWNTEVLIISVSDQNCIIMVIFMEVRINFN